MMAKNLIWVYHVSLLDNTRVGVMQQISTGQRRTRVCVKVRNGHDYRRFDTYVVRCVMRPLPHACILPAVNSSPPAARGRPALDENGGFPRTLRSKRPHIAGGSSARSAI